MSQASDQITEYLSVGGLFNPEFMNQTQHEAVRNTLIKARDDIQKLERENAALNETTRKLNETTRKHVAAYYEMSAENAALRKTIDDLREQLCNRNAENAALRIERNRYRVTLEDIAEAAGIWASDKARAALTKEERP